VQQHQPNRRNNNQRRPVLRDIRHHNNAIRNDPAAGQQQQRLMANGQHATWFQGHIYMILTIKLELQSNLFIGIHSMGHSLASTSSDGTSSMKGSGCHGGNGSGKMVIKTFQAYLPECCHRTYSCVHCRAHLANHDELISKVSYNQ